MLSSAKVLFISYDGMTDPLGQSQVLPYLIGLSQKGIVIHLISFEKKERFEANGNTIKELTKQHGIVWHPLFYTKNPPIISTVYDVWQAYSVTKKIHAKEKLSMIHCRGYISSLVGSMMKNNFNIPYLFDMRAFYADERVDGGLWNQNNILYRKVYQYFKKKEILFLETAAYTISLTEKGKKIIHCWKNIKANPVPIQVIPCCANLDKFDFSNVSAENISLRKKQLYISEEQIVVSYLGSVGTWYMPNEMMDFFASFRKKVSNAVFLFITTEPETMINALAKKYDVPTSNIRVISAKHYEVPELLSVSNFSLFFIKPVFSKSGSSPTKMGEIMGLGIPLICNAGVGDVDEIVNDTKCGILLSELNENSYETAIDELRNTEFNKVEIRKGALKYYSLKNGVEKYYSVYKKVLNIA